MKRLECMKWREAGMIFGICEDNLPEANWLNDAIVTWAKEKNHPVIVKKYEDAERFWFDYEQGKFAALFLDIKMPGENGVDLAKGLRRKGDRVPVVFVTGEEEYLADGYEVEAVHYLIKPVASQKLRDCLERIWQRLDYEPRYVLLQTDKGSIKIRQQDIYKIEVFGHQLYYDTAEGNFSVNSSLKTAEKELQNSWFVCCYRGILVNLWHVESIVGSSLTLVDNEHGYRQDVPVSRRLSGAVNQAFIDFYRNRK
ncbi:MAG: response regulator transcription factor [Lachnospiraceae bacterium]|nr:response regulator transcription factor [Lachnospiraceae bacterium]